MAERETEDRRVRKTKKQLRGALTSLLLEKDISRVTVRDVADLADVNRGTFYAHYSDVYDLLHQLEDDLLRRLDDVGSRHNARQSDGKTFRYLTDLFTLASEYSDIFYTLYCRSGDSEFQDKIFNKLKYQYLYEFLSIFGGERVRKTGLLRLVHRGRHVHARQGVDRKRNARNAGGNGASRRRVRDARRRNAPVI